MADQELTARIEDILGKMALAQKCALLSGDGFFTTREFEALGIPRLIFSDGPHGMRHQGVDANHLGIGGSVPATCFPTAVTVANSWEPRLGEELGHALAEEAASMGVSCVLGPGLNIKRSPLCGRNFEYFSEDPYLAGTMAAGYVRGIQETGLSACPKHFAANSQETRRLVCDSVVDERTLRELYLRGFEIVVGEAGPQTIMTSYNLVNGSYANENEHLVKDVLRGEWGYEGAVVTDWGGSNDHVAGVAMGSTFEMPGPVPDAVLELEAAVNAGRIPVAAVDARVREALTLILSTRPAVEAAAGTPFDVEGHHQLARRIAAQGIVLLKNDASVSGAPLLPLAAGTRVALIGEFGEVPRYQGAGSSFVNCTKLETLKGALEGGGVDLEFVGYARGFRCGGGTTDELVDEAVRLARDAEVVLVALGLDGDAESEGSDRRDLRLDAAQTRLLEAVAQANPQVVVVLHTGSPVETDWAVHACAVVYAALGGQAGALATLDVLTGKVNPSGHLAETWPRSLADTPTAGHFPSEELTSEYREGIYVGYRYYQKAGVPVAYPFGFGLSYTSFAFSELEVKRDDAGLPTAVAFDIENTGECDGAQVCQLYVSKRDAQVFRPVRELKGSAKVFLKAGERARAVIRLDERAFQYWNVTTNAWEVEGGGYELGVGTSCEDLALAAIVEVVGSGAPNPYEGLALSSYETGQVKDVPDTEFAALLGHEIPVRDVELDRNLCFRDFGKSRSPLLALAGLAATQAVRRGEATGTPSTSASFVYNMPLRALAKDVGQFFSMGMVDALVREAKGWGVAGVAPALAVRVLTKRHFMLTWGLWMVLPLAGSAVAHAVRSSQLKARLDRADREG